MENGRLRTWRVKSHKSMAADWATHFTVVWSKFQAVAKFVHSRSRHRQVGGGGLLAVVILGLWSFLGVARYVLLSVITILRTSLMEMAHRDHCLANTFNFVYHVAAAEGAN